MTTSSATKVSEIRRRVVLVDFDWQDADLIPELLAQPAISVRLVAGSTPDDAGVRLAELCGLPRTVDLADLTREIFDLALISERSPRRTQIEGLLLALGTPSLTPQSFMANGGAPDTTPGVEAPLELHAAAMESALGGEPFDRLVEQALPDISDDAPTSPPAVLPKGDPSFVIGSLDDFPSIDDRRGLENALQLLMSDTGAGRAELHVAGAEASETVVEIGPSDALLRGLVELARERGTPQVVASLGGPPEGVAWGAWPFRTATHRGVLAAAGISPAEGWSRWQRMVEELRDTWDHADRQKAAPAFPMVPAKTSGVLDLQDFRTAVDLAVERHNHDGLRFSLHRLDFPSSDEAVTRLLEHLPKQVRGTDSLCRPRPRCVLLLTTTPREEFPRVQKRIASLWETVWLELGLDRPVPGMREERVEIRRAEDLDAFSKQAKTWLEEDEE
ncbi:MAG TPA: hypothetical protein VFQ05_12975 [Candidatus Eisenbacteria bacterium]|nr:hypothetical protein [Candidatus Eisenbacteria bacterium]